MRTLSDIHELHDDVRWLIRLRALAAVGAAAAAAVASRVLHLQVYAPGLYATAAFVFLYNLGFAWFALKHDSHHASILSANLQISLDLLSLTALLHFSGSYENPFVFFYVFHAIVAGVLLTHWMAIAQTMLAVALFAGMIVLEWTGALRRWPLQGPWGLWFNDQSLFVAGIFAVLVSTLLIALYMALSISERSRRKNLEISAMQEELALKEMPASAEELLRSEKLASLGQMAAGIAHEINNPLTVVLMNVDMALAEAAPTDPAVETLRIAKEEIVRCRGIIEQLLTFARGEDVGRRVYDANKVLRDSIKLIENYAKLHRVKLEPYSPDNRLLCRINPDQMKQVLVNVMMNGIQAMPNGGTLRAGVFWNDKDRLIEFKVQDTGGGIPKPMLSRIFDPFFTTKKPGQGTGLGLSVCHRLVEINHGRIEVDSDEGQGTRVTVCLPCGEKARTRSGRAGANATEEGEACGTPENNRRH
ncbi:MAG: ATP-binding protein [Candidatus Sumerlaeota bacterium]|nr:ATP-binding protein [Candidatus Sumerlaeota bacterium]